MKRKISFAGVALLIACSTWSQTKKEKAPPPPPPSPPVVTMAPVPPPPPAPPVPATPPTSDEYNDFINHNPDVKDVAWSKNNTVHIYLKSGEEEVYDLNKKGEEEKLVAKYGKLPIAPPPPPPLPPVAPKAPRSPKKFS